MNESKIKEQLTPEGIVKYFKDEFKTKIKTAVVKKRTAGSKKRNIAVFGLRLIRVFSKM